MGGIPAVFEVAFPESQSKAVSLTFGTLLVPVLAYRYG